MFQAYADASALESVALYAAMVMPALLLQNPHSKLKAKEHTTHLDRRLKQWMGAISRDYYKRDALFNTAWEIDKTIIKILLTRRPRFLLS